MPKILYNLINNPYVMLHNLQQAPNELTLNLSKEKHFIFYHKHILIFW